jgi:methylphosphotriester-DNA--protein-cysteine methyltransferase
MATAPVVQPPEHGKARRRAEVTGADRVAADDRRARVLFKAKYGLTGRDTSNEVRCRMLASASEDGEQETG